jgi:hypothetical protein
MQVRWNLGRVLFSPLASTSDSSTVVEGWKRASQCTFLQPYPARCPPYMLQDQFRRDHKLTCILPPIQTSSRLRDPGGGYRERERRGHGPQLSISDDNHHVTEAIGDMYGESDYPPPKRDSRPLSFISSPLNGTIEQGTNAHYESTKGAPSRMNLSRSMSNDRTSPIMTSPTSRSPHRTSSMSRDNGPTSPARSPMRDQSPSETARTQFPLNDVDYESNPAAVQQELSNLQALRRMSMDVNSAGDPDLPAYAGSMMPSIAPSVASDEEDESRLFWVPARLHPELAPTEFKTFIENRVDQIKRRSGGESSLSAESPSRQDSGSSLRRKKSMLSRQIDNSGGRAGDGYKDGAERLEKKRSISGQQRPDLKMSDLEDLDDTAKDPQKLMRKLSVDAGLPNGENGQAVPAEDLPILPIAPLGNSLRRSTRTAYRRGSLRKGENVGLSKRRAGVPKAAETDTEESPKSSPTGPGPNGFSSLNRVQTEPPPTLHEDVVENFSRPSRSQRGRAIAPGSSSTASFDDILNHDDQTKTRPAPTSFQQRVLHEKELAKTDRYSAPHILTEYSVPQIIETPPPPEDDDSASVQSFPQQNLPERTSSYDPPSSHPPQGPLPHGPSSSRAGKRSAINRPGQPRKNDQTLHDIVGQPSPLPGNSTRTDSLSFIPTFSEDKKSDKKKDKKDKDGGDGTSKKSSWGWFSGNGEKHQHKDKDRDSVKDRDSAKKSSARTSKTNDKSHDNTRLDLLQTSIDGGRGRESLVLDRDSLRLEEERKKEGSRKSSGSDKAKESGLFSFFGGGKKKGDKDSARGKNSRGLSPDPPQRIQRPDLDYNWTRFPLIEERAIYRMAHIKLANPRRALYSQVLLSNFMYSYLDKVQAMHPQPTGAQQAAQKQNRNQHGQQSNGQDTEQQESQYYQKHEVSSFLTSTILISGSCI